MPYSFKHFFLVPFLLLLISFAGPAFASDASWVGGTWILDADATISANPDMTDEDKDSVRMTAMEAGPEFTVDLKSKRFIMKMGNDPRSTDIVKLSADKNNVDMEIKNKTGGGKNFTWSKLGADKAALTNDTGKKVVLKKKK